MTNAQKEREQIEQGSWLRVIADAVPDAAIETEAIRIYPDRIERVECGTCVCMVIDVRGRLFMGDPRLSLHRSTIAEMIGWASDDVIGCWRGRDGVLHYYADGAPGDGWVVVPREESRYADVK